MRTLRPAALLLALLSMFLALPVGCATPAGQTIIKVTRECAVEAGRELVGPAITEVESALAIRTVGSAIAGLESLGSRYGIGFVSCAVDRITRESARNLALARGTDPIAGNKVVNGDAWLSKHPLSP